MSELAVVRRRTIRGEPDQVHNAIEAARRDGRLVRVTEGRRLTTGQVEVVALMLEAARPRDDRPWFRRRPKLAATMVACLVGFLGLVVWIAYQLVTMVVRNFAAVAFVASILLILFLSASHKVTKAAGCCPCHRR